MSGRELTLYYREGCHLCDEMLQALRGLQPRLGFGLRLVDVDGDPALVARYDESVPVLSVGGRDICHYRLDEAALREVLRSLAGNGGYSHGTHGKHGS
ncbi:MAG: glutaredoxin family protein [Gammaproteobacteria bacterium]